MHTFYERHKNGFIASAAYFSAHEHLDVTQLLSWKNFVKSRLLFLVQAFYFAPHVCNKTFELHKTNVLLPAFTQT